MKKLFFILIIISHSISYSQNKPSYPEPQKGFKRVDLILPKIENEKNYQVEVKFGQEVSVIDCADASFSFPIKSLKTEYGIPYSERFPYYILTSNIDEITQTRAKGCNSKTSIRKKILSFQNIMIEYQSHYARPFYIPESWTLEYRIWKASDDFTTIKK